MRGANCARSRAAAALPSIKVAGAGERLPPVAKDLAGEALAGSMERHYRLQAPVKNRILGYRWLTRIRLADDSNISGAYTALITPSLQTIFQGMRS